MRMTEEQLLAEVTQRCAQRGVWWVHIDTPYRNKRRQNMIGFPDLFLCGPGGIAFWELKSDSPNARIEPAQRAWGQMLKQAGQEWAIIRPGDLRSGLVDQMLDQLAISAAGNAQALGQVQ